MGVLETLLAYKQQKDAQAMADVNAIPQAVTAFQIGKQQAKKNLLDELTLKVSAAKGGFDLNTQTGQLTQNPDFATSSVFSVDSEGNLSLSGSVPKSSKVFKQPLSPEQIGSREEARVSEQQKAFKEPEIQGLVDLSDARDTLSEVRSGLDSIGIKDTTKFGNVITESIDSELGPISLPARFNLVGQYAKDPKYTALKGKMERAFQKFRKVVTGAQASYQELQNLRPLIASFKDRPGVFFENLNTLEDETNRMVNNRISTYEALGRNVDKVRTLYSKKSNSQITDKQAIINELKKRGAI